MGKSQARRLREATKRFGRENWGRWYNSRAILSILVHQRKKDAGLIAPTVIGPDSITLTYFENEDKFGRARQRYEDLKYNT